MALAVTWVRQLGPVRVRAVLTCRHPSTSSKDAWQVRHEPVTLEDSGHQVCWGRAQHSIKIVTGRPVQRFDGRLELVQVCHLESLGET